jgi:glycosyltransferase involved in cell wall biosynthesis
MKKIRIAFYCTNEFSYPLPKNIVYAPLDLAGKMAKALEKRGHSITFYTASDSKIRIKRVSGGLSSYYSLKDKVKNGGLHNQQQLTIYEQFLASKMYEDSQENKYDIIHAFHLAPKILPFVNLVEIPTVFTLHDPMDASWNNIIRYCKWRNKAHYVSISNNQRRAMPNLNYIMTVYNGLEVEKYEFQQKRGRYLAFLGRYSYDKGVDIAARVADKSKERLKMAGVVWDRGLYNKKVKPYIKKGSVEDVGFLGKKETSAFLCGAKALLFPIRWEEPFGLVMIEAMACGTPIIAFNRGSVSEIVKHGETGFIVNDEKEMLKAVKRIDMIDRRKCREHVEKYFTIEKMVDKYEKVYEKIINRNKTK